MTLQNALIVVTLASLATLPLGACVGGTGDTDESAGESSSGSSAATSDTASVTGEASSQTATASSGDTSSSGSTGDTRGSTSEMTSTGSTGDTSGSTSEMTSTGSTGDTRGSTTEMTSTGSTGDTRGSTTEMTSTGTTGDLCGVELASCAMGESCCEGLECCAGVPVPQGKEFCASMCPKSDRNLKSDVRPIDTAAILGKVVALPISSWRYTKDAPEVRHLGPMAQDFAAAFGLWDTDKMIFPLDEGGVSLAAIQGLYQRVVAAEEENAALRRQLGALESRLQALEAPRPAIADAPR